MFCLWWTHAHKREFLNLWASLTASSNSHTPIRKLVTGEFDDTMRCAQPSWRGCCDFAQAEGLECSLRTAYGGARHRVGKDGRRPRSEGDCSDGKRAGLRSWS